jgi:sterol desaturase/sphingolipid hydroxylase (fatty acid hydroxylase superfamily)
VPEIRTFCKSEAGDAAVIIIAGSARVSIGNGTQLKSFLPLDATDVFALTAISLFLIMLLRYFSVAGLFYLLVWKRPLRWRERELNLDKPKRSAITREILWSTSATFIFAVPGAFMLEGWKLGWTRIYLEPTRYGLAYFVLGPLLYMALHDTYFYWTHRLLHQPWWFRHAHYTHHESRSPSPWASFSFHPLESVIEALFIPGLVFVLPIHVTGLVFVLTSMTIFGVINHLGYEIYPRFLVNRGVGRWFISATHHNWHHRRFNCNYALYFRLWDIWMGTDRWPSVPTTRAPEAVTACRRERESHEHSDEVSV